MSYIQPNSTIKILRGIDFDKSYDHTIWFDSEEEQANFFLNKTQYTFTNQTYQRKGNGRIKISVPADSIIDCNYMMFKNTSYLSKWFYAFIDNVEYVSNNACMVHFTLDIMQSYFFDYELGQCLVEREHSQTEDLAYLQVPEDFDGGEQIIDSIVDFDAHTLKDTGDPENCLVIWYVPNNQILVEQEYDPEVEDLPATFTLTWNDEDRSIVFYPLSFGIKGLYVNKTYSGLIPLVIPLGFYPASTEDPLTNVDFTREIGKIFKALTQIQANIVSANIAPFYIYKSLFVNDNLSEKDGVVNRPTAFNSLKEGIGYDAYTPVNAKMRTYPYMYAIATDNNGSQMQLKFERSKQSSARLQFFIQGVATPQTEMCLIPKNYNGAGVDYEHSMTLVSFPSVSWSEDSFTRWWAQNKTSFALSLISGALTLGTGIITQNPALIGASVGALTKTIVTPTQIPKQDTIGGSLPVTRNAMIPYQTETAYYVDEVPYGSETTYSLNVQSIAPICRGLNSALNALGRGARVYNAPDTLKGQSASNAIKIMNGKYGFSVYVMTITAERAKLVDKFFTMYGYASKEVKVPNRNVRKSFTFTKTGGCIAMAKKNNLGVVVSSANAEVLRGISAIYDKGITFWHKNKQIGNYDVDNGILA